MQQMVARNTKKDLHQAHQGHQLKNSLIVLFLVLLGCLVVLVQCRFLQPDLRLPQVFVDLLGGGAAGGDGAGHE